MAKASFKLHGSVGEIVIADPPLNLFGRELAQDLAQAAAQAQESKARAVLVHAEGDNFSAGANVELFLGLDKGAARALIDEFMPAIRQFEGIGVPTICAVQGLCLAAGLEVALACDLIWATEDAQLGLVETLIGATPFGGGTQRLASRAGPGRAAEAVLTGRTYSAETMREWGVVNRVVPADALLEKTRAFAERLAAGPTLAHAATKRMIRLVLDDGVQAADAALPDVGAKVIASDDLQRGARSLIDEGPGHASFDGR